MNNRFFVPARLAQGSRSGSSSSKVVATDKVAFNSHSLAKCSSRAARELITYEIALKFQVLPLGVIDLFGRKLLSVATRPDASPEIETSLRFATGMKIKLIDADPAILEPAIFAAYHGDEVAIENNLAVLKEAEREAEQQDLPEAIDFRAATGEAASFLRALIDYAIARNASDLHIVPRVDGTLLRLRSNGELFTHKAAVCSLREHARIINRIKVLAKLDTTQRTLPQDGSFSVTAAHTQVHIRVSTMPTVAGEKAVLRFAGSREVFQLRELGLSPRTLFFLERVCKKLEGAILFCGPTGSGKTTTMYSVLESLSGTNSNLVSIEDPVEATLEGVSQTALSEKEGLTYARCLRAVVRQDPDVILLGEIRDAESAQMALQATLTGHLLLSTIHARNVFDVLLRLRYFGVDDLTTAQGVALIICQRLTPVLCSSCKVFDLKSSNRVKAEIYQPVGCKVCDYTGFLGRALSDESLFINQAVSKAIAQGVIEYDALKELLDESNYVSMKKSIKLLLHSGVIGMEHFEQLW
ncbi:GspE/PulE family protein [Oligoflexia bacterium]|nr:GspE/PulE family protein [Oligoflexia bacterium]